MCVVPHDVKIEAMGLVVDDDRSVDFAQLLVVILVSPWGIHTVIKYHTDCTGK